MHISQKQIDIINNKYTFLDEYAFDELMKRQYNVYAFNTEDKIKDAVATNEWKDDIKYLHSYNHNFTSEELDIRIKCKFEDLFKNTFKHLKI